MSVGCLSEVPLLIVKAEKCIQTTHQDHCCYCLFNAVSNWDGSALPHPGVGERGVAVLRVELQSDESDLYGDPGHHSLHRLILGDAHVLEGSWQENHPVCDTKRKVGLIPITVKSYDFIGVHWLQCAAYKSLCYSVTVKPALDRLR